MTAEDTEESKDQTTGPGSVLDTFVELVETVPLDQITYEMISEKSAVPVSELERRFPNILDLADAYFQRASDRVIETYERDPQDSYKDTLFDVMMTVFDEFSDDRTAVKNMIEGMWKKTYRLPARHTRFIKNMQAILDLCQIDTKGLLGRARQHSLGVIFVMCVKKWLEDDSPDMAATMAELDKHLSRAEETEQKLSECNPLTFLGAKNRA